jgi:hypothetical protein
MWKSICLITNIINKLRLKLDCVFIFELYLLYNSFEKLKLDPRV